MFNNPKYYSSKNKTNLLDIKSGNKYYFIGDCKHKFLSLPCNAFRTGKLTCPYCCGKRVLRGFNDIWTTNPEIAILLENSEDGYRYTAHSNKKLKWKCNDCGRIFEMSPGKLLERIYKCPYCSDCRSYGEKFVYNFLEQLYIPFEMHVTFEWSDNKEYDFYIPENDCIIEVNGKQHYTSSDFSYLGGRHYYEEIANDEYKKDLALKNKIVNYITVDARESNMEYLKKSIINTNLPILLNFNYKEVEWNKCNEYALCNEVKLICRKYNEIEDINIVAEYFHCSYNTIKNKLKQGAINKWCDYDAEEAKRQAQIENGKRVIKTMSKPVIQFDLNGNFVKRYTSIQQAQRENGFSHIWDCIKGKRKTVGGFQWRYENDCENVSVVTYEKSGKPYKSVVQYSKEMELINVWDSIAEAARKTGINKSNIIAVCNNKQRTAGGYIWRYKEDCNESTTN